MHVYCCLSQRPALVLASPSPHSAPSHLRLSINRISASASANASRGGIGVCEGMTQTKAKCGTGCVMTSWCPGLLERGIARRHDSTLASLWLKHSWSRPPGGHMAHPNSVSWPFQPASLRAASPRPPTYHLAAFSPGRD
eukprot:355144-Chlamydomonas_euryale.AAC.1